VYPAGMLWRIAELREAVNGVDESLRVVNGLDKSLRAVNGVDKSRGLVAVGGVDVWVRIMWL
jgi:hypothetical protein